MSFGSPFFDFFDAINNEVQSFNRQLDGSGFYYPRNQLISTGKLNDKALQKADDPDNWLTEWSGAIVPPVDLVEHEKNYELNVTIPGVKDQENIDLEYHKEANQIVVSGHIPPVVSEENKDKVRVREVASGNFKRVITLPKTPGVDADNIKADYVNGILKLNVPKLKPVHHNHVKKIKLSSK